MTDTVCEVKPIFEKVATFKKMETSGTRSEIKAVYRDSTPLFPEHYIEALFYKRGRKGPWQLVNLRYNLVHSGKQIEGVYALPKEFKTSRLKELKKQFRLAIRFI